MESGATTWGQDPDFVGPRHQARLALMRDMLVPGLPPGARTLDVGAGAGRLVAILARAGYDATGLEPSEAFVAYATAHAPAGARYVLGEASQLPFADRSFQAVSAGEVLEHLVDDVRAVAELWRVLAPGGRCVITVPADPSAWDFSDDWAGHVRRYEPQVLQALFQDAGFEAVSVRRWGWPFGTIYHQRVFLPLLARKRAAESTQTPPAGLVRRLAGACLGWGFALDRLFLGGSRGHGLILVARKSALNDSTSVPSPGGRGML